MTPTETPPCTFATLVRSRRLALGLRQEDFGRLVGVSNLSVHYWERGTNRPQVMHLTALAQVLGIDVGELVRLLDREAALAELSA